MQTTHRFEVSHLQSLTQRLLMAAGTPHHIAADVAEILVNANLSGHDSHGVLRIPAYLNGIEHGAIQPTAEPEVVKESASTLVFDGNNGFGHYVARKATQRAMEKAKQADVCCVSLVRIGHIGRLGEYAEQAARAGCIALISVGGGNPGHGRIVPFGGAKGALGTNPIAVGVPTGDDAPFVIDYATSMIAEGKIQVARSLGTDLPPGCIVDKDGNPSVKVADFYEGGFLLPFGGHKGYALALLTCLLGGLSGNFDAERGAMGGAFMQVINASAFTSLEGYQRGVRAFLDGIKATPPAPGFDEVLVPGDFERRSRAQRRTQGIEVPDSIYHQIREWAERLNVPLSDSGLS